MIARGSLSSLGLPPTRGAGGGSLLSRVQALFDGGTYPGFMFKASRFGDGFFYQESTGQTLVTATTQSIGLAFDASRMGSQAPSALIADQPELVTNGTFDDTSAWTLFGTGATIGSGKLTVNNAGASGGATQNILDIGAFYLVEASVTVRSGQGRIVCGGYDISKTTHVFSASGTISVVLQSTGNQIYIERHVGVPDFDVDNVSVKKIPGYHATQSTSNSRPTLQQPSGYAMRFDGVDDYLATTLVPQSSGALIFGGTMNAAADIAIGCNSGTAGRCFIAANASGYISGGIGGDSYSTIQGSADITGADGFNVLTWNGTTVELFRDDMTTPVYSAAQNGVPNTAVGLLVGGYNNNGTPSTFADADIDFALAIMGRELSASDRSSIKAYRES